MPNHPETRADEQLRFAPLDAPAHFGFFVIHARAARRSGVLEMNGVFENLAGGAKLPFESIEQLVELLREWGQAATAPKSGRPADERAKTSPTGEVPNDGASGAR